MTKNRKISAVSVLIPLMMIFAIFMMPGCDGLFNDGDNTGKDDKNKKIGEITGTITLTDIPATGRPKVTIRAGIDATGLSYDSEMSEISLGGVTGTQATLNWSIPVYENEEIPPYAFFSLYITPLGTTSSLHIILTNPVDPESMIGIPENHVVGFLGTYSIGTTVLSGNINVNHNGTPVPRVEIRAYADIDGESIGFVSLTSPAVNAPWTLVVPSFSAPTDLVLEIRGWDNSWNNLFEKIFTSDLLTNVSANKSGININLGDVAESGDGKTITITNIPEAYYDMYYINAYLILSLDDLDSEASPLAYGYGVVDNTSMTLELLTSITDEPWTGTGSYYVVVSFTQYGPPSSSYVSKNQVSFATNPTVNLSTDFDEFFTSGEEGKTITITNIPGEYIDTHEINVYLFEANTNIIIGSSYFSSAYGYNYADNSSVTVELYEPVSYDLWTGTGSYYVVVSFEDYVSPSDFYISKNKVSFTENPTINFSADFVKYNDFTPPGDTVTLIEDIWESGYLSSSDPIKWYSFNVQKDANYEIFVNDSDWDDDYNKADVLIDIYLNGVKIRNRLDIGFLDHGDFTVDASGTVHVRVYLVDFDSSGSFDIGYNTSGYRANLEWPLTNYTWKSGNFEHSDVVYFSFQAETGKTYNIWWDDFDIYDTRIDVQVSVYLSNNSLFEDVDISTDDIFVTGQGKVIIAVTPRDSANKSGENFEVAFSTNGTRPDK